jgi:hypothetical protein
MFGAAISVVIANITCKVVTNLDEGTRNTKLDVSQYPEVQLYEKNNVVAMLS